LGIFSLKSATERFRVSSESFQPNISIEDCIGLRQTPYLDASGAHVSSFAEAPMQKKQNFGTSRRRLSNKATRTFPARKGSFGGLWSERAPKSRKGAEIDEIPC
jgi:hypothetical protein